MLTEYEAAVLSRSRTAVGPKPTPALITGAEPRPEVERISIARIKGLIEQAHQARSAHLRAIFAGIPAVNRIGVVLVLGSLMSAVGLFYGSPPN